MMKRLASLKVRSWLFLVTGIALAERIFIYLLYRPVSYNDTASYRRLAFAILDGWRTYDGTRTPGYPLFLALLGADERVFLAQLVLGFLTTLLLFYVTWRVSGRGLLAGLVALAHTFNPQQLFFEADLLTETLTTFLIVLSVALLVGILFSKRPVLWKVLGVSLMTGLVGGFATLARPLFIFVPFWMALFLLVFWRSSPALRWSGALMTGLAGAALLGAWVAFIHMHFGMLGLTTMTGYHLVQHTGLFFEYVPDKYAAIRDVFLQYRAAQIAATGSPGNAIWAAIPALQKVSGLNFYDLSNLLAGISIQLIIHHPFLFMKNVILGWIWFWKAPVYYLAGSFRYAWMGTISGWIIPVWRGALILTNIAFVGGSVLLVWKKIRQMLQMDNLLWFLTGMIWLTSIAQTLLDHGDNPRFLVPVQSLVVLVVLCWGTHLVLFRIRRNEKTPA